MPELEATLVDMALSVEDMNTQGFVATMENLAARVGGHIEFDIRVDHDINVQRIASVVFVDEGRIVLVLSSDGQQITRIPTKREIDSDFFHPLAHWHALPLADKAFTSINTAAVLLLGALRSRRLLTGAKRENPPEGARAGAIL